MVIKVPIYMEFADKLSPAEVSELQQVVQREMTQWVRKQLNNDTINLTEWKQTVSFKVLSIQQVLNRLTKSSEGSRRNPVTTTVE